MGLLDALFSNDSGGGLLGGLPSAWQYQNPQDKLDRERPQIQYDALGNVISGAPAPADPFGPIPQSAMPAQAPPIFSTGTVSLGGNGPSGPMPGMFAPQMPPQAVPAPAPAAPQLAPSPTAPAGPINSMDIGGYQMPQFGSVADYRPTATIPQNAQPTQGQLPQTPQTAAQQPGIMDHVSAALQSVGAPGSLFRNVISNPLSALVSGQRQDATGIAQQNQAAQFHAIRQTLIANGEKPDAAASKAMLAVMNPEAGKTILSEALTNREKFGEIGSDSFGNKTMGFINERDQTINGKPMGSDNGTAAAGNSFLAPGVKGIDSTLTGKDYLDQFSPEVQAAVQNYVDGKSTPTGNPRKGFTQTVKMIAQKYGADTGQSVDDATYAARRTMRNQLSSSAPASLGGQINIGNTAAGHLADLSQKALELGNVDTGIAPLTAAVNGVRGLGTEQAAKMEALKGAAQHYGQEITKFYAGSPGGTAERDRFIESVNGARSPKELAAILSTEGELMRSRLDALGGQIKGVLGDEGAKQYPVLRPDGQAALAKVEENVSRLKGGKSAAPTIQEGATATNPQTGQKITFRGGKWQ